MCKRIQSSLIDEFGWDPRESLHILPTCQTMLSYCPMSICPALQSLFGPVGIQCFAISASPVSHIEGLCRETGSWWYVCWIHRGGQPDTELWQPTAGSGSQHLSAWKKCVQQCQLSPRESAHTDVSWVVRVVIKL